MRIERVMHGNVGRRPVSQARSFPLRTMIECAVTSARDLSVVVCGVHLSSDKPAHGATDENVAGEMSFSADSGQAHSCGQAVSQYLGHQSGILVGQNAGRRPGERRVDGWKRRIQGGPTPKLPLPGTIRGTLTPGYHLERFRDHQAVDSGFARKNARLLLMIVAS